MRIWKRLLGTALCLCAAVCVMSVSASAEGEHTEHPICGANHENIGDHTGTCNNVIWTEVTQDNVSDGRLTLAGGGSYYLGTNIAISNGITINGTVNLCLNGHSITKTSESDTFHGVIKVESGSSFTLCDCNGSGMGNGKITHADGVTGRGVLVGSSSVKTTFFLMYGGTISGNRINGQDGAGVRVHNASFKMYGGTISENHVEGTPSDGGGGVNARGKFIMYGGEISRNTSNGDCGGVAVVGDSFEMHGGIISGNTATGDGGGVGLWNDSFRLSGGTISGNTATRNGGGVYFSGNDSDTLTISGTVEISGNSAANGGGVHINSQDLAVTGGSIINNNAADGSGGGVYFNVDGSSFNVSGNVSITGNKKGATPTGSGLIGADNNVYLPDGKTITVAGALTGSNKIGVTTENKPSASDYVRIASGNTNYAKPEKFLYENDGTIAVSAVVTGRITKLVACQHNWSGEWATDAAQHWKECSICNGKKDDSAHTYDRKVAEASYKASDANCVSPALYHWSCVCGAAGAGTFESGEKDPDKHRGALGGWQSDENNHWKEYTCCQVHADEGIHQWGEGRETKSPTCTAAGEKTYTCSVCSGTKKETLDALGHNYSEPSYAWNGTSCTAERVCSHDSSHKETETVTAAVTVTQNQSCLSDELSTYTASFQNAAFAAQTQENVVTANKLGHDFENGTWQSDEDEHWKKCSRCDVTDEANKAPHSGGTATCIAKAECVTCGTAYGALDANNHIGVLGVWQSNEDKHWKEYSCCNVHADVGSHHWDEGRETKSPTCTEDGVKTFTCSQCNNTKTEPISALGHDFENGTWQSDGDRHWKKCSRCDVTDTKTAHRWNEGRETKSPTCTTAGEKTYTCSVCSGTKKETLDALGHNYSEPSYAWNGTSCTAERVCSHDSSHKETETVTAAVTVTQNQSCLSDELSTYTASFQNAAFAAQTQENVVTANKLGHDFENGTWQSDEDEHWKKCSRCDVTDEANKAPHSGGTATCIAKAECVTCGTAYGALDANNHIGVLGVWQSNEDKHWKEYSCCNVHADVGSHHWDEGRETKSPTCTEDGVKTFTCSQCNNTKTEPISALGHDFENGTWQSDGDRHWKKCSRCDVTDTKTAHRWNEGRETKSPTCTTAGEKTYICTDCGRTKTEQIDALGHDWGEWVVTKPATTSAAGEETRTCKRDTSHTETHDIPKLTPAPSGGGSSSGSSSAPAITVPVSGSGDTVHVSASVSGSTAEVKEIKSAELDKIGTDSTVVIDLSGLNKGVTGVTLSTDTIDSICKTEADGVTVKLPSAELRVDRQTLAAVTEQAAGSKLRLVVEPDSTARNTMTAAQRSALDGMRNAAVLEAYFVSDGTRIRDFNGGSVELSIPYRADGAIRAWFLKEDGTREPVSARYDKENARLLLHHFSHYVIEELDSSAAYTVCAKDDSCPLGAFGDLTATAWYHDGVHYCLENGLMRGVSGGKFLPDGSTTRAQLVTILWRLEGSPETTSAVRFGDTAGGAWYTEAVRWAAGCGVVKGYDNGRFGPNDAVTREQMAAILYRYAQHKGYDVSAGNDTNILSFDDAFAVSEYAIPAMQWACGSGMVRGIAQKGGMLLAPRDTTTRAQTATLLMRFQIAFAKEP